MQIPTCPFNLVSGLIFCRGTYPLFTRIVMLNKAETVGVDQSVNSQSNQSGSVRSTTVCSAFSPEVRAVKWGDDVGAGLPAGRQASGLPGLPLRVDHRAGQDVKFLRVVEPAAHPHSSVLQAVQLQRTEIQAGLGPK